MSDTKGSSAADVAGTDKAVSAPLGLYKPRKCTMESKIAQRYRWSLAIETTEPLELWKTEQNIQTKEGLVAMYPYRYQNYDGSIVIRTHHYELVQKILAGTNTEVRPFEIKSAPMVEWHEKATIAKIAKNRRRAATALRTKRRR